MLFQMRFSTLFTLLLSLIVPAGSASADMCFNFENCYKKRGKVSDRYTAFSLSIGHIVLVVFYVIVAKQCYQIGVVGLVGCKVELTASLATFLHTAVDEVLKKFPRILTISGDQISVIRSIVPIIVDGTILNYRQ